MAPARPRVYATARGGQRTDLPTCERCGAWATTALGRIDGPGLQWLCRAHDRHWAALGGRWTLQEAEA